MKKILILDAFSTIHVGNGVLIDNSLRVCKEVYPDSEVSILTLDKETNLERYKNVYDDVFYDFPRSEGLFKKLKWLLVFTIFAFFQIINAKFLKIPSKFFCFNGTQRRLMQEIDTSDMCLSIAGETINDNFYPRLYQRSLIFWLVTLKGKKMVVFPQSIGPIFRGITKKILRVTLGSADLIVARDYKSFDIAKSVWKGCKTKVQYSPDVGVLQKSEFTNAAEKYFHNSREVIGLTLSQASKEIECHIDYEKEIVDSITATVSPDKYNILMMPSNYIKEGISGDYEICQNVKVSLQALGYSVDILPNKAIFEDDYQAIQKSLVTFISTRMHVGILSTTAAVPTIMINTQHKIRGYMKNIDSEDYILEYQEIRTELPKLISKVLEPDNNAKYRNKLKLKNGEMKEKMKPFLNDFSNI